MTATQAPTPGPLTSESVKLLVKGDLLRCINPHTIAAKEGEIRAFECRTHNEPGAGNDIVLSDSYLGTWSGIFAFIGRPDADGWMPWSGGENPVGKYDVAEIKRRDGTQVIDAAHKFDWLHSPRRSDPADIIAFRLAPTAPVEASGSEREVSPAYRSKLIAECEERIRNGNVLGAVPMMTVGAQTLLAALRPQPSGETREAVARIQKEIDLGGPHARIALVETRDLRAILALLSAHPLALGGQQ